jgi:hypothetical protein
LLQNTFAVEERIAAYAVKGLVNDHPQLRTKSMKLLVRIMDVLKERASRAGTNTSKLHKKKVKAGDLPLKHSSKQFLSSEESTG